MTTNGVFLIVLISIVIGDNELRKKRSHGILTWCGKKKWTEREREIERE